MAVETRARYRNFDILVQRCDSGGSYPISATVDGGDPAEARMILPYALPDFPAFRQKIEDAVLASAYGNLAGRDVLSGEGKRLLDALLTGDVRDRWIETRAVAQHDGGGVRLRLFMQQELASLPWEILYDSQQHSFLATESRTPLSRYLAPSGGTRPLLVEGSLKILAMKAVGQPADDRGAGLQTGSEEAALHEAVARLQDGGVRVDLKWVPGEQTYDDLLQSLKELRPHIFHFIGHGGFDKEKGGFLLLGGGTRLHAEGLSGLLSNTARPAVVVLNSCEGARGAVEDPFSSLAWQLAFRGIPAVIAMQYRVSNDAAIQFSKSLYNSLASYEPIDVAVASARHDVRANQYSLEWATTVLYMGAPDGQILEPQEWIINVPGRHGDLEATLQAVAPGRTVALQAGVHEVKHGILLRPPVKIIGAGREQTVIRTGSGAQVLSIDGEGPVVLRGLSVESEDRGPAGADVVTVTGGTVDIADCVFRGGRSPAAAHVSNAGPGAGLRLQGAARGTVTNCVFMENAYGVVLRGADVLLSHNHCEHNSLDGIYYLGDSRGSAQENTCSGNGKCGFLVAEHAQPTLDHNVCEHNGVAGIAIGDYSKTVARGNTCNDNPGHGILVFVSAEPTLEGNTCRGNGQAGIWFRDRSKGLARDNTCGRNGAPAKRKDGIWLTEQARPRLERNQRLD